ncbi:22286_t:CDS:1, partial [Dentiscutata erythropus]
NYTETLFIKACGHYWDKNVNLNIPITQLTLPSKFYAWVLTKFGVDAKITKLCFEDILKARINIDKQLQQTPNVKIPIEMNPNVFYELCGILRAYNKAKNFYLPLHLNIISQCKAAEILMPLFKCHLPKLFKESIDSNMLHEWEDVLHMLHNNLSESTEEFKSYFLGFINRKK